MGCKNRDHPHLPIFLKRDVLFVRSLNDKFYNFRDFFFLLFIDLWYRTKHKKEENVIVVSIVVTSQCTRQTPRFSHCKDAKITFFLLWIFLFHAALSGKIKNREEQKCTKNRTVNVRTHKTKVFEHESSVVTRLARSVGWRSMKRCNLVPEEFQTVTTYGYHSRLLMMSQKCQMTLVGQVM